MPRTDTDQQTALEQRTIGLVWLAAFEFDTGTQYVTNAPANIEYNGNTYRAVGDWGGVEDVQESGDGRPVGMTLALALPEQLNSDDLANDALNTNVRGRRLSLAIKVYNPDGTPATADPIDITRLEMDHVALRQDATQSVLVLQNETAAADLTRPNGARYTDSDQRQEYANDRGFEYVAQMDGRTVTLGDGSRQYGGVRNPAPGGAPREEVPRQVH